MAEANQWKIDPELLKFYNNWARRIELLIQGQAPVKTGTLKNSVQVKFAPDSAGLGGKFVITTSAEKNGFKYGLAFQYGTLDFYTRNTANKEPIPPGQSNDSSKKGIKPLFWMNLKETDLQKFEDELAKEIGKFSGQLIRKTLAKDIQELNEELENI